MRIGVTSQSDSDIPPDLNDESSGKGYPVDNKSPITKDQSRLL